MAKKKAVSKSYLIRLLADAESGRVRIRLEEVHRESRVWYFADVDSFIGYLLSSASVDTEIKGQGDQAY